MCMSCYIDSIMGIIGLIEPNGFEKIYENRAKHRWQHNNFDHSDESKQREIPKNHPNARRCYYSCLEHIVRLGELTADSFDLSSLFFNWRSGQILKMIHYT